MAYQDRYLNLWDERYHALVSRNLMDNPFLPVLRNNPIAGFSPFQWTNSYIWLHKQPLFMWQLALSMKVFGVSELAIRYPSVLMGALMVVMLYSITKSVTKDKNTALFAALIFCFSGYHLEQTSGREGMEHNDIAFHFYVLASIWAYVQYTAEKKIRYVLLVGLFAGCAVLNKWFTGILVFAGWGVNFLLNKKEKSVKRDAMHLLLGLLVCAAVFMPWQFYTFHYFPVEANHEYAYNTIHLTKVVEGHEGNNFHYLDRFPVYFGEVGWFFVPAGFVVLLLQLRKRRIENRQAGIALLVIFGTVFVFFSYIVMTKIAGYFYVVAPIGAALIVIAITELKRQFVLEGKPLLGKSIAYCLIIATTLSIFNPDSIKYVHDPNNPERKGQIEREVVYKNIKKNMPSGVKFVFNTNLLDDINIMFYNNDIIAYSGMVDTKVLDSLSHARVPFAAFESRQGYEFPDSFSKYTSLYIIHKPN
jgi:4-amino-4-deoxy-L-arabinose transferase-like glycosyltransferase